MQVDDIGIIGKSDHKIRYCRTDVADHHAADYQYGHALYPGRHKEHQPHGNHGAGKCPQNQHGPADRNPPTQKKYQDQGNHHLGPGGNPQHVRPGNGICKKGLQKKTGNGQRSA